MLTLPNHMGALWHVQGGCLELVSIRQPRVTLSGSYCVITYEKYFPSSLGQYLFNTIVIKKELTK